MRMIRVHVLMLLLMILEYRAMVGTLTMVTQHILADAGSDADHDKTDYLGNTRDHGHAIGADQFNSDNQYSCRV